MNLKTETTFWMITTNHLTDRLWFKDEEDYKTGMNYVAVLAAHNPVMVIAFILMSNHVHFLLAGTEKQGRLFVERFKKKYSQYYSYKYGSAELLRGNEIDAREVSLKDESFERAVAYIQMNSVAANNCLHPSGYPWGTGDVFFSATPQTGIPLGSMSARAVNRMTRSKESLPDHYMMGEKGYITPRSFVPVKYVESVFRTPRRMNYFLQNSSKARRLKEAPSFDDSLVLSAVRSLCVSLFRKTQISELSTEQKAEIMKQLRYRFSAGPHQLSRISGLSYQSVSELLDQG